MSVPDSCQTQSKWVEIFNPTSYTPVLDSLSLYLTIADILILCQVCKGLANLKDYVLAKVSDINKCLEGFVSKPAQLRSKLGQYDALISGAFARSLFDLRPIQVVHLDIFIANEADAEHFMGYLESHEGYEAEAESTPVTNSTARQTIYSSGYRPGVKVRIFRTSGAPIHHILSSSYTTACINVVTWNKAYSVFPLETFVKHRFFPLKPFDYGFGSRLNELSSEGWTSRDIIWPDFDDVACSKVTGLRRIGDTSTLTISLNVDAVTSPSIPDFVVRYSQFEVSKDNVTRPLLHPRGGGFVQPPAPTFLKGSFLRLRADQLTSQALRYSYTMGSSEWSSYVSTRLRRWAWLELFKAGSETTEFGNWDTIPLVSEIPNSVRPETWDYADDQIPNWYMEWQEQRSK